MFILFQTSGKSESKCDGASNIQDLHLVPQSSSEMFKICCANERAC